MTNLQFILIQCCVCSDCSYLSSPLSREDGAFTINNVPSGSYVVEVANPDYAYEPVRVEINSKGKYRARKVNYIQTSQVVQVPYPLKMKPLKRFRYFQVREQWRVTDFLFSPMVSFRRGVILSEKVYFVLVQVRGEICDLRMLFLS